MNFGKNLQYLRKMDSSMTQERLAEIMGVSRQTVSKWEYGEVYPEIEKIIRLCDLFSCTMDELMRDEMDKNSEAFSSVRIETIERFRMARYVIISPQPENDVNEYIRRWAKKSGLLEIPDYELNIIGWDFPFVTSEQRNIYGLRGYVAACIIPESFSPRCDAVEIAWQEQNNYGVITITDPFTASFDLIPNAYQRVFKYFDMHGIKKKQGQDIPCFEKVYEKNGTCYMDVYIAVDALTKSSKIFNFN